MTGAVRHSTCSGGLPVDVYWHGCIAEPELERHVDAIVEQLMDVIKADPRRRWNPYNEVITRREFRARILAAARGELKPLDHVKSIEHPLASELFEIRWSDLRVTEEIAAGKVQFRSIEVRLLHAEPATCAAAAIGLHAHEKVVIAGDRRATRRAQDDEIVRAVQVWATVVPTWLRDSPVHGLRRGTSAP